MTAGGQTKRLKSPPMNLSIRGMGRKAQRTRERIEWLAAYRVYLESPGWLEKRRKVFERCKGVCEGCANRRAVQVHHLRYPPWPVMPGSAEWERAEKLWDLVGVCERCHREVGGDT
jgi:5-methylcytosine-specific restriction endonuclease McrA